jgi:hypothetical protein
MRAARLLATGVLALAAVTAAGCNDFHYYDIHVSFNNNPSNGGFGPNEPSKVQICLFKVSGADNGTFSIGPNRQGLPLIPGGTDLGIVEFSTFADSGTLTFTVEAYDSTMTVPNCKVGVGSTDITATSASTTDGMLSVNKMGDFTLCQ